MTKTRAGLRLVLFDMDGVLVDVSRSYRRAIRETVRHFTGAYPEATAAQRLIDRGGFKDDWELTHALILSQGSDVRLTAVISEFQRHYRGRAFDGFITDETPLVVTSTLQLLSQRSLRLGIVTGRPTAEARWTVARFGWQDCFPVLMAREDCEPRLKPEPYPLQLALSRFAPGILPEQALYVGDSVDDMTAAKRAGMWAAGCVPPYLDAASQRDLLLARGADFVTGNPDLLPALLDYWRPMGGGTAQKSVDST